MEAALNAGVPGIRGECGGALACATCHVVVEHCPSVMEAGLSAEQEMLEFAEVPAREAGRLSCQQRAQLRLRHGRTRIPQRQREPAHLQDRLAAQLKNTFHFTTAVPSTNSKRRTAA